MINAKINGISGYHGNMNKTPTSALGNWEGFPEKIFYHSSEAWKVVSKGVVGLAFKVEETRHGSLESPWRHWKLESRRAPALCA